MKLFRNKLLETFYTHIVNSFSHIFLYEVTNVICLTHLQLEIRAACQLHPLRAAL